VVFPVLLRGQEPSLPVFILRNCKDDSDVKDLIEKTYVVSERVVRVLEQVWDHHQLHCSHCSPIHPHFHCAERHCSDPQCYGGPHSQLHCKLPGFVLLRCS
jgi:hypothetical protein